MSVKYDFSNIKKIMFNNMSITKGFYDGQIVFNPIDNKKEMAILQSMVDGIDSISGQFTAHNWPGFYTQANVDIFTPHLNDAKVVLTKKETPKKVVQATIDDLSTAYTALQDSHIPISKGWYVLKNGWTYYESQNYPVYLGANYSVDAYSDYCVKGYNVDDTSAQADTKYIFEVQDPLETKYNYYPSAYNLTQYSWMHFGYTNTPQTNNEGPRFNLGTIDCRCPVIVKLKITDDSYEAYGNCLVGDVRGQSTEMSLFFSPDIMYFDYGNAYGMGGRAQLNFAGVNKVAYYRMKINNKGVLSYLNGNYENNNEASYVMPSGVNSTMYAFCGLDKGTVYEVQIYDKDDNTNLLHDWIPCLDQNDAPCWFDTMTHTISYQTTSDSDFVLTVGNDTSEITGNYQLYSPYYDRYLTCKYSYDYAHVYGYLQPQFFEKTYDNNDWNWIQLNMQMSKYFTDDYFVGRWNLVYTNNFTNADKLSYITASNMESLDSLSLNNKIYYNSNFYNEQTYHQAKATYYFIPVTNQTTITLANKMKADWPYIHDIDPILSEAIDVNNEVRTGTPVPDRTTPLITQCGWNQAYTGSGDYSQLVPGYVRNQGVQQADIPHYFIDNDDYTYMQIGTSNQALTPFIQVDIHDNPQSCVYFEYETRNATRPNTNQHNWGSQERPWQVKIYGTNNGSYAENYHNNNAYPLLDAMLDGTMTYIGELTIGNDYATDPYTGVNVPPLGNGIDLGNTYDYLKFELVKNANNQTSMFTVGEFQVYPCTIAGSEYDTIPGMAAAADALELQIQNAQTKKANFEVTQTDIDNLQAALDAVNALRPTPPTPITYDYLEFNNANVSSSEGSYIDTGIIPCSGTNNDRKHIEFKVTDASNNAYFTGCWASDYTTDAFALCNDVIEIYYGYDHSGGGISYQPLTSGEIEINAGVLTVNNTVYDTKSDTSFNALYPLFIGGQNRSGIPYTLGSFKLWYYKIYDGNNNLIRDFVPAINNNEAGLYDNVTGTFYGNANTAYTNNLSCGNIS